MQHDPDKHHRRSIRLKGYDYARAGAYFVTICVQNKECLFGNIADAEMRLNDAGHMVARWWQELAHKFSTVETDEFIVMPNHFHGIVVLVGADLRVCPVPDTRAEPGANGGAPLRNVALGEIVQWFKTITTNEYIRGVEQHDWQPFAGRLWQRNYYEHIIRTDDELERIRDYIVGNPAKWAMDEENPKTVLPRAR